MAYNDLSGYQTAYDQLLKQQQGMGSSATSDLDMRLNAVGDQFTQLWTNLVGRAPTSEELNGFMGSQAGNIIANSPLGRSESNPTDVRNQIAQYVGDTGQKASQDYATQQLEAQQGQANNLAELFRSKGKEAISATESSLLDYQQRLFERLRPNLITSLQSQGLLNTGGLNQAVAGAESDLALDGSNFIRQANFDNDQAANAIAFGGASAPYNFQQGNIMNQPNNLLQQGQNALNANTNTFMSNLAYQQQLGLMAQQNKYQRENSSFLRTLGTSFAGGLGSSAGTNLGKWVGPSGAASAMSGGAA